MVYRARQLRLNRLVAVKMIVTGEWSTPEQQQRFKSEAEAAAKLNRPAIVAIHEVGEVDGLAYFPWPWLPARAWKITWLVGRWNRAGRPCCSNRSRLRSPMLMPRE